MYILSGKLPCKRCTKIMNHEEIYYLLGNYYCRACENTITNDPDYKMILENYGLRNIEN